VKAGFDFYKNLLLDTGFWIWAVPLVWIPYGIIRLLKRRSRRNRGAIWREIIIISAFAGGMAGIMIYSTWPILLPRYAITFVPPLALVCGATVGRLLRSLRRGRSRNKISPFLKWTAFGTAAIFFAAGTGILYYPVINGWLKIEMSAALCGIIFPVAGWLYFIKRRDIRLRGLGASLTSGLIITTFGIQFLVMGLNYIEARKAFQTVYRGQNIFKNLLVQLPAREQDHYRITGNIHGEFVDNTIWFLKTYSGRLDLAYIGILGDIPIKGLNTIFVETYPHPPDLSRWIPPGFGQWEYIPWLKSGDNFAQVLAMGLNDPPVHIFFPAIKEPVLLGRVVLRFDTRTVPWTDRVVIRVLDKNDVTIGEAVFRGMDAPRQHTNAVPFVFPRPAPLLPGNNYRISISVEEDPTAAPYGLKFLQRKDMRTLFLLMESENKKKRTLGLGLVVYLVRPLLPTISEGNVKIAEASQTAFHVESPAAIIHRILFLERGAGYSTQSARWIRYTIKSSRATGDMR
jgi:hypothetical protein